MNFAEMDGEALSTTAALPEVQGSAPKTTALGLSQQKQRGEKSSQQGEEKSSEAPGYPQLVSVENTHSGEVHLESAPASGEGNGGDEVTDAAQAERDEPHTVDQLNFGPGDDGTTEEPSTAPDAADPSVAAAGSSDTTSVPSSRVVEGSASYDSPNSPFEEEEDDSDSALSSLTSEASDSHDDESAAVTDDKTDLPDYTAVPQTVSTSAAVATESDIVTAPREDGGVIHVEEEDTLEESPVVPSTGAMQPTSLPTDAGFLGPTDYAPSAEHIHHTQCFDDAPPVEPESPGDTQLAQAAEVPRMRCNRSATQLLWRLLENPNHYTGLAGPSSTVSLAANRQPDAAVAVTGTLVQAETAPSGDVSPQQPTTKDLTLSSSESSEDEVQTNGHGSFAASATAAPVSEGSDGFEAEADQMTEGEPSPPPQKTKRGQQSRNHPGKSISKRLNRQDLRASVPSAELRSAGGDVGIERSREHSRERRRERSRERSRERRRERSRERRRERSRERRREHIIDTCGDVGRERSRRRADVRGKVKSPPAVNALYQDKKRGKRLSKHPDKSICKNSDRQGIGEVEPTATCSGALGTGGKRKVVEGASANSTDVCKKKKLKDSGSSFPVRPGDHTLVPTAPADGSAGGDKKRKRDEEDPEGERPVKRGKGDEDATSKIAHEDRTQPHAGSM